MAEFKISRLRYRWRGPWTAATNYIKDDVIHYGGSSWYCIRAHYSTSFYDAQFYLADSGDTEPTPAWAKMTEGFGYEGSWTPSTSYIPGTVVSSGGNLWTCIETHESSAYFSTDFNKWTIFATGLNWVNSWTASTRYKINDIVRYNGILYRCINEHTSASTALGITVGDNDLYQDSSYEVWETFTETVDYKNDYAVSTRYRVNDLVKYGGSIFQCIEEHTSGSIIDNIDNSKFSLFLLGLNFRNNWNSTTYYAKGDIVRNGSCLYIANNNNNFSEPGITGAFPTGNSNWTILKDAVRFVGIYDEDLQYKKGDLVRRGGSLWVALGDDVTDGSTLDYLDTTNWKEVLIGYFYRGLWLEPDQTAIFYNKNDVVYFEGSAYLANQAHFATVNNFPGDNGSGFSYWDVLALGEHNNLIELGDLVTFNLNRGNAGDASSLGQTRIPIGDEDEVLHVSDSDGSIAYKVWGNIERVFHVRTNGEDVDFDVDPNRGINYWKPFRTIAYALERANDGYLGTTTVRVYTGEYQEVLPMIVPKRTAIDGDELRSVTIKPNNPLDLYENNKLYFDTALVRLGDIVSDLILGNTITVSTGNDETQSFSPTALSAQVSSLTSIIGNFLDYSRIEGLGNAGTLPTVTGSNTAISNVNTNNARQNLLNNKNFLIQELYWYAVSQHPTATINEELFRTEITSLIEALRYDLIYAGNYKTLLTARRYCNKINGSSHEDMFYVRDATGIRNCTLKGLSGTLPNPVGSEPYSRPTGGSYVSLDPGWGPNDESVWITTRSCYVQNVTTFGYAATGQKIDGSLHNGGNRSIVSNDFTQVISDGIGAHVLNGGRAELVSVFTYYSHIGMFAEDGGIIRATNGNSSYGDYGAVADGNDPSETPQLAKVNTRNNEAVVASALAGEVNDYIVVIEFANAGQEYTSANYTILGSGSGATLIQEEFRDNGIFETQVRSGGNNYFLAGNNAQTGDSLTITLSTSDDVTSSQILGMRIILTSGEGTGQYGYVQAYNAGTKLCTVYRESDDQPGWDHVQPGTPSASLLTTGTQYRFEPRVTFSDPGFTSTSAVLANAGAWSSITYGETEETFTAVGVNTGAATFNVVKTNRSYTVTLNNGGTLYTVGQIITIAGNDIGGTVLEHDIEITISTVSVLGAILTFTYEGLAVSGHFVIAPTTGDTAVYSRNGESWQETSLPSSGNWKCLAAGNNKFVAIRYGSDAAASSTDGITWTASTMPASRNWNSVVYGGNIFVAVAGNQDSGAISTNGTTWTTTTLPDVGDSTQSEWIDIAYGHQKFVALANSNNAVAVGTYNSGTGTMSWTGIVLEVQDSTPKDWTSIAYGNGRFVAVSSTGDVSYSFNGSQWYTTAAGMPNQGPITDVTTITPGNVYTIVTLGTTDFTILGAASNTIGISFVATQPGTVAGGTGSVKRFYQEFNWRQIRYGQGVFFAVAKTSVGTSTDFCATSYDGIVWTPRILNNSLEWSVVTFGNPDINLGDSVVSNNTPIFVAAPANSSVTVEKIQTGARALGRAVVEAGEITLIKMWEPGSGYINNPTITLTDPNATIIATTKIKTADGVLSQPTFINRGSNYRTSTTQVTITGDGFADIQPVGRFITLDGLTTVPGPGAQFYIAGRSTYFTAVITGLEIQSENGTFRSTFRISPSLEIADDIQDDQEVIIRERYSQVRITGHDFLDVGTGNFVDTNYPLLYVDYEFSNEPQNEVNQLNGGRVFYTSTDQDGNFRAGELFAVEQATGIVTISADFFDLQGLSEIALGGVIVGGSGTVVREFSTDPLFIANSNNIIPTQRAIKSYLESRLNIGGEDLLVPSIIAGTVQIGPNQLGNTAGLTNTIPVLADFSGPGANISGSILAQTLFYRSFKDDGQVI